jgi:hypothetical protein
MQLAHNRETAPIRRFIDCGTLSQIGVGREIRALSTGVIVESHQSNV